MTNNITFQTIHRGFAIIRNECGWFNVPAINCWSSPTVASAMRAIDAHLQRQIIWREVR